MQRNLLLGEIETKSEIAKLTIESIKLNIENQKLDQQIKVLTLRKLETDVFDNDYMYVYFHDNLYNI